MRRQWVYIALFLSLAANLLIVGMVIGRQSAAPRPPGGAKRLEFSARSMGAMLPDHARQQMRQRMRERRDDLRRTYLERRALESRISDLIAAETLDRDVLEAAIKKHMALSADLVNVPLEEMLEVLPTLTQEERQRVAEAMQKRRRPWRRRLQRN